MTDPIIDEARRTLDARADDYGHDMEALRISADLWSAAIAYFPPEDLTPARYCLLMALMQIGREIVQPKRDNLVDAIGYIELAGRLGDG